MRLFELVQVWMLCIDIVVCELLLSGSRCISLGAGISEVYMLCVKGHMYGLS